MQIQITPKVAVLPASASTSPTYKSRQEAFSELFPEAPAFRWRQIESALLSNNQQQWSEVTSLPQAMRDAIASKLSWLSINPSQVYTSKKRDTYKVAFNMGQKTEFESVLMANKRGNWTICVSSQIGCGMGCSFCATGKMGFKVNLHADHIIDQYRFWNQFVKTQIDPTQRISNIVFMGMGEPLANYIQVKSAIQTLLKHTDLGPTRITVSSVGVIPVLNKLLTDPDWPAVRIAISLHSADKETRKEIIQTSYDNFLDDLAAWGIKYLDLFGNRRHHLTFEYVMLNTINDSPDHARKLVKFAKSLGGEVRVNLIPYNYTGSEFVCSVEDRFEEFMEILESGQVKVTRRKTMGDDIAAACGQLVTERENQLPD